MCADPASLRSWGILALLPRRDAAADQPRNPGSLSMWVCDFIKRCVDLGMDLGFNPKVPGEVCWDAVGMQRSAEDPATVRA